MKTFSICKCLYSKNIFLKGLNIHVEYHNKKEFLKLYSHVLAQNGVTTEEGRQKILEEIEQEVARRRSLATASQERQLLIEKCYRRKHPDLFQLKGVNNGILWKWMKTHKSVIKMNDCDIQFQTEFLAPEFIKLVDYCKITDATFEELFTETSMKETNISRAYTIPVFTEDFCQRFLEEIQNFEESDCPKGRPNTMNNYGVLLDELGFNNFISDLRENYLCPLSEILYPDWGGTNLDSHKAFIVQYKVNEDKDLSFHFDNAEVTLNVALSPKESYSGGKLYFGTMRTEVQNGNYDEFEHKSTVGLIHRGQHKHGARPISSGARYNLIIWMRSSSVRNKKCPMCDLVPELEETVGFGGGFIKPEPVTVDVCCLT